jgi:hypothetical protein
MPRFRPQDAFLKAFFIVTFVFGGCSCDSHRTTDAAVDASVPGDALVDSAVMDSGTDAGDATTSDSGIDGGDTTVGILIHRNVAGGSSSTSNNYRLVRTHGRGAGGSSMSFTHRDGVHGGVRP